MKPVKLTICGWGPYRDEITVDFESFEGNGIFLITGVTGAGKTTIFDAVTYALYGSMSGEMREKGSVRSDFAVSDTKTYVNLKMTHHESTYELLRNPEYLRPKKRKGGSEGYTKEKENAVLKLPDGKAVEGIQEVNKKVQELLGLDERQFKQITMIAQGEFARLLSANGAEKTKIFREIFQTGVYDRFAGTLRERSKELHAEIQRLQYEIRENISFYEDPSPEWEAMRTEGGYHYEKICGYLKEVSETYKQSYARAEKDSAAMEKELLSLTEEISMIKRDREFFGKLSETLSRKQQLDEKKAEMQELEQTIQQAEAARKVSFYEKAWLDAGETRRKAEERVLENQCRRTKLQKEEEVLYPVWKERTALRDAIDLLLEEEKLERRQREVEQAVWEKQERLRIRQAEYQKTDEEYARKKRAYDDADRLYKCAVVGVAARMVEQGKPCPVCGSLEHPQVARAAEAVPDEKQLKLLKEVCENSEKIRQKAYQSTLQMQGETQEARKQLEGIKEEKDRLTEKKSAMTAALPVSFRKPYEQERTRLEEQIRRYESLSELLLENYDAGEKLQQELTGEKEREEQQRQEFWSALKEQKFQESDYRKYLTGETDIQHQRKIISDYYENVRGTDELLIHLRQALKGKKQKDAAPLEMRLAELGKCREENRKLLKQLSGWMESAKRTRKAILEKREGIRPLEAEYGLVKDLDNLAAGNNPKRLVFEQYVLAGYFEEILKAANIRLCKMSEGRYEMLRAEQASDGRQKDNMEILVMDYYTGKSRSVKTLSGGETFKASLSLALGMSDVIQAESGGIRVEALFIDEGFGSLDSESLDLACETLSALAEQNKMIGIISHVPELRDRIASQIIVEKTNHGSYLKIVN